MVLKMLKGLGRLMLTTSILCGVGLFLCSSEVKAAVDASVAMGSDGAIKVTVTDNATPSLTITSVSDISDVDLNYEGGKLNFTPTFTASGSNTYEASITKSEYITAAKSHIDAGIFSVSSVDVNYTGGGGGKATASGTSVDAIYKMTVTNDNAYSTTFVPTFTLSNDGIGYKDDEINVTVVAAPSGYSVSNYYSLVYTGVRPDPLVTWKDEGNFTKSISSTVANNDYKVIYLPKISTLEVDPIDMKARTSSSTATTPSPDPTFSYSVGSWVQAGEGCSKTANGYSFDTVDTIDKKSDGNDSLKSLHTTVGVAGKYNVGAELFDVNTSGSGKITLKAVLNNGATTIEAKSVNISFALTVPAKEIKISDITLYDDGFTDNFLIVKDNILPKGASQNSADYTGTIEEVTSGGQKLDHSNSAYFKYDDATGKITLKAKSGSTGVAKVKLTLKEGTLPAFETTFNVNIEKAPVYTDFDVENTVAQIKKSGKNFITYDKDKSYKLDIKQMIIDNARDSENAKLKTLKKTDIEDVVVVLKDGKEIECKDGYWTPTATGTGTVVCTVDGEDIDEDDEFTVTAYPLPTKAEYSGRTVSVELPAKATTAYSDSNSVGKTTGFTLILEDANGNSLSERNVDSTSKASTSEVEGLVSAAASTGKFSNDTTSVRFKVVPRGTKPGSSDVTTADKAINKITGSTTVYKITASGTNFDTTAAYGLDGQSVTITATPKAGYTFEKWSDGNTANPRTLTVSASGTRSFTAVAKESVPGGNGTDKSELYDDVPKTAESNSAIWLIVFMVFAVMGTTYALYLQLKAASAKNDK